jgi:hypothetical protein
MVRSVFFAVSIISAILLSAATAEADIRIGVASAMTGRSA